MKISIICQSQFGHHIDTYYYSVLLSKKHKVDYYCWDYQNKFYDKSGDLEVFYKSRQSNTILRNVSYIWGAFKHIISRNPDVVFIKYFKGASLLKILLPNKKFVLDIRTVAINRNGRIRIFEDFLLKFESKFFSDITVVSSSAAKKLNIKKYTVVPLGAEVVASRIRERFITNTVNFLYVGTFTGRNINKSIEAMNIVRERRPDLKLKYTIIGTGIESDISSVRAAIERHSMEGIVHMPGFLRHDELKEIFVEADIGVAYVPVTDFYNVQPSTKIYEYVRSAIPVIATNTDANIQTMQETFGVVAGETPELFAEGILSLIEKINNGLVKFSDEERDKCSWDRVVSDLDNYLQGLI